MINSKTNQPTAESDQFSLKDLNKLLENVKELNKTIDRQQLKEMGDVFKEFFSGSGAEGEDIDEAEEYDREKMDHEGGAGALIILIISFLIFLVAILMMVRCYYKKRQFLASRMIEHKPLASHESQITT